MVLYRVFDGVYAVGDLPAVYVPSFKAIVLADIHLGFEEEMASKGVFLPRIQLSKALEIIERCLGLVEASTLVVAGDLKHHFEKLGRREAKDLREFLGFAVSRFKSVVIVRGNHDTFLYQLCNRVGVSLYDSLWLDRILVVHGHRELGDLGGFDLAIMGHEHPSIALKDPATGYSIKLQCFLLVPLARGGHALVLPAAGVYQSGTAISTSAEGYLSPVLRREAVLEEAKPFAIVEGEGVVELPRLRAIEDLVSYL